MEQSDNFSFFFARYLAILSFGESGWLDIAAKTPLRNQKHKTKITC